MPDFPHNHGGKDNGGGAAFVRALESSNFPLWDFTPEYQWECRVGASALTGAAATQIATVTVPAAGIASGALTVTFTGGGLVAPVEVIVYAAVGDDERDVGNALEVAVDAAILGDLAGVIADVENDDSSNVVNMYAVAGVPLVTVVASWRSAEQYDLTLSGTLVDADYAVTISGGGLGAPVVSTTTRATTPATIGDMIVQVESDLEGLIATTLADVLVSADDDASDTNTLIFEPDIADVTVTTAISPNSIALQFGGTPTDGSYATTFLHASLPGGEATVTTARSGGTPATNADLAVQHEADIEADVRLYPVIVSADDDGVDTNIVITHPGVTGLTATTADPSPGTLTQTPLGWAVADVTPAGPAVTVTYGARLDLNVLGGLSSGPMPPHVMRDEVALEVLTAFEAGGTITVGDLNDPDGLLGSTPVVIDAAGRTLSVAADAEHETQYEAALVPTATFSLGASPTETSGVLFVQVNWSPHPSATATGAA